MSDDRGQAFSLQLDVETPLNQTDLLNEIESLDLIVEYGSGAQTFSLSSVDAGSSPEVLAVDPLEDVTVALAGYRDDELIAFGRSAPITATQDTITANLVLARVDDFIWLDMPEPRSFGAVVPAGDGRFWISGGITDGTIRYNRSQTVTDTWAVASIVDGLPTIEPLDFPPLPPLWEEPNNQGTSLEIAGRAGHVMTPLADGALLVGGGTAAFMDTQLTSELNYRFDPSEQTYTPLAAMNRARSFHPAIPMGLGEILMVGGMGYTGEVEFFQFTEDMEVVDPTLGAAGPYLTRLVSGPEGAAAASVGEDGVLVCGGFYTTSTSLPFVPVHGCDLVGPNGDLSEATAMEHAIVYGQMVRLGDGGMLVTGGVELAHEEGLPNDRAEYQATKRVWLYRDDVWQEVSPMRNARALHAATRLADGRVLVVGGLSRFQGLPYLEIPQPLACAELYEPDNDRWTPVGDEDCTEGSTSGALPVAAGWMSFAVDDDYGVLLFGGIAERGQPVSKAAWFIGRPQL